MDGGVRDANVKFTFLGYAFQPRKAIIDMATED
ncbi:MAG: hypothetical protein JWL65_2199 [Gammaproteobacteria bacterium]|nr:hypothetical protein [Gammaproteobacteria bacterium]